MPNTCCKHEQAKHKRFWGIFRYYLITLWISPYQDIDIGYSGILGKDLEEIWTVDDDHVRQKLV
jgi:hypothetical protein